MLMITLMDLRGPGHQLLARSFTEANTMLKRHLARARSQRPATISVRIAMSGDAPIIHDQIDLRDTPVGESMDLQRILVARFSGARDTGPVARCLSMLH